MERKWTKRNRDKRESKERKKMEEYGRRRTMREVCREGGREVKTIRREMDGETECRN